MVDERQPQGDRSFKDLPVFGGKPVLGISIGDPAGIGPEITLKALGQREISPGRSIYDRAIPVVYADRTVLEDALKVTGKKFHLHSVREPKEALGNPETIDFIEAGVITEPGQYSYGKTAAKSGDAAFQYVIKALQDAMAGKSRLW